MRFQGKNVLITGGANGIGRATAQAFASEGATVIIADVDGEGAMAAAAEIRARGAIAHARTVDIRDEAAVNALFAAIAVDFAPLDVAVNCAGVAEGCVAFEDIELAQFQRTMVVNVEGLFLTMRAEIRLMKRQGHGAIVNVAGQLAHEAMPHLAAYGASAHAIAGLTKAAALETARANIQINAISPGFVETAMLGKLFAGRPEKLAALPDTLPTGRLQQPEQVASAILFLASEDAAQFIGQSLRLDGGGADVQPSTLWHYPKLADAAQ